MQLITRINKIKRFAHTVELSAAYVAYVSKLVSHSFVTSLLFLHDLNFPRMQKRVFAMRLVLAGLISNTGVGGKDTRRAIRKASQLIHRHTE